MDSWVTVYEYGKMVSEERISYAETTRRFLHSKTGGALPLVLKAMLLILSS
jgi:hypothetical protein